MNTYTTISAAIFLAIFMNTNTIFKISFSNRARGFFLKRNLFVGLCHEVIIASKEKQTFVFAQCLALVLSWHEASLRQEVQAPWRKRSYIDPFLFPFSSLHHAAVYFASYNSVGLFLCFLSINLQLYDRMTPARNELNRQYLFDNFTQLWVPSKESAKFHSTSVKICRLFHIRLHFIWQYLQV